MRSLPEEFDAERVPELVGKGWDIDVEAAVYAPVGAGSYHWIVDGADGARRFVTVDDLDRKAWLGDDRDAAFAGLTSAFDVAVTLRESGLEFVIAPVRSSCGDALLRCGARYAMALFPLVSGSAGAFGRYEGGADKVARMLAELHGSTPAVTAIARTLDLRIPGRPALEAALRDMDEPWSGGPLSESARSVLREQASGVRELLALFDRLAQHVDDDRSEWVITHGEPHAANVMWSGAVHHLVDWDTVALAPRERDLWLLVDADADAIVTYASSTGHEPDPVVVELFRLMWDLSDIAAYTSELRSAHEVTADAERALRVLASYAGARARYAPLLEQ